MHIQIENIFLYIHHVASIGMFIYTSILLYTQIYAYIGVFWLTFGLVLNHTSIVIRNRAETASPGGERQNKIRSSVIYVGD